MDDIQKALDNVMIERSKFYNKTINSRTVNSSKIKLNDITEFIASMNKLITIINANKNLDYNDFIMNNLDNLKKLKSSIISKDFEFYKKNYDSAIISNFRTIFNRIFTPIKYKEIIIDKEYLITEIFTEFVKGITYFKKEEQELRRPIYHRDKSCGTKNLMTIYKFRKTLYGPTQDKMVERCYIERIIYDKLYNHILHIQDFEHEFELLTVSRIFQDYFPNIRLNISIDYSDIYYPTKLTIIIKNANNDKIIEKYEYIKNKNSKIINGHMVINNQHYHKIQTYDLEEEWKLI
jgi:hypothetical protein